jgi:hypothetical protein
VVGSGRALARWEALASRLAPGLATFVAVRAAPLQRSR